MALAKVFLGPAPHPTTGQSLAFSVSTQLAADRDLVLYTSGEGRSRWAKWVMLCSTFIQFARFLMTSDVRVIYFTCSRSPLGFIRDALFILAGTFFSRARLVNHLHGADFAQFRESAPSPLRKLIDAVYTQVDCSIVLHESMREQFSMYGDMNTVVLSNFVEDSIRKHSKVKYISADCEINVLFLSNILASKGVIELVRAVDFLAETGHGIRLTIAGQEMGHSLDQLLRASFGERYRLGAHVSVVGPVGGEKKAKLLQDAHIFALPSYAEAVPISALEAMTFGCALVLSNCRYLPTVFSQYGVLFAEPRSWESLRDVLQMLVKDRTLITRLGSINYSAALTAFGESQYLRDLADILERPQLDA